MNVVVIGAGMVGLSCAYSLAQEGVSVTVVDGRAEGDPRCSNGNAGMIVPSHYAPLASPSMVKLGVKLALDRPGPFGFSPRMGMAGVLWSLRFLRTARSHHVQRMSPLIRDLNLMSRDITAQWHAVSEGGFTFNRSGLLMVCENDEWLHEEASAAETAQELGLETTVHDREGLARAEPNARLEAVGAVEYHDDCATDPAQMLAWLRKGCLDLGVVIADSSPVSVVTTEGGSATGVVARERIVPADAVVIAAGAASPEVAKSVGLRLPLVSGKGYSFVTAARPGLTSVPTILVGARAAINPYVEDGVRISGTMILGEKEDGVNKARLGRLVESVNAVYPEAAVESPAEGGVWTGLRPCLPDGLPAIGPSSKLSGLYFATCHGMMGVSLAAVTGRLIAENVLGRKPSVPLHALSPKRFRC